MRRMWLWVLLYAIVLGFVLFFTGFAIGFSLGISPPSGIAYDIGQIASMVGIFAAIGGFFYFYCGYYIPANTQ
jgi:hypothetical protein